MVQLPDVIGLQKWAFGGVRAAGPEPLLAQFVAADRYQSLVTRRGGRLDPFPEQFAGFAHPPLPGA